MQEFICKSSQARLHINYRIHENPICLKKLISKRKLTYKETKKSKWIVLCLRSIQFKNIYEEVDVLCCFSFKYRNYLPKICRKGQVSSPLEKKHSRINTHSM